MKVTNVRTSLRDYGGMFYAKTENEYLKMKVIVGRAACVCMNKKVSPPTSSELIIVNSKKICISSLYCQVSPTVSSTVLDISIERCPRECISSFVCSHYMSYSTIKLRYRLVVTVYVIIAVLCSSIF